MLKVDGIFGVFKADNNLYNRENRKKLVIGKTKQITTTKRKMEEHQWEAI